MRITVFAALLGLSFNVLEQAQVQAASSELCSGLLAQGEITSTAPEVLENFALMSAQFELGTMKLTSRTSQIIVRNLLAERRAKFIKLGVSELELNRRIETAKARTKAEVEASLQVPKPEVPLQMTPYVEHVLDVDQVWLNELELQDRLPDGGLVLHPDTLLLRDGSLQKMTKHYTEAKNHLSGSRLSHVKTRLGLIHIVDSLSGKTVFKERLSKIKALAAVLKDIVSDPFCFVDYNHDSQLLNVAYQTNVLVKPEYHFAIVDIKANKLIYRTPPGSVNSGARFAPDGKEILLFTMAADGRGVGKEITVLSPVDLSSRTLVAPDGFAFGTQFKWSPDNQFLAIDLVSESAPNQVAIYDVAEKKLRLISQVLPLAESNHYSVKTVFGFSRDSKSLLVALKHSYLSMVPNVSEYSLGEGGAWRVSMRNLVLNFQREMEIGSLAIAPAPPDSDAQYYVLNSKRNDGKAKLMLLRESK